ncbi:tetratricopeptide repeat protein [Chelatococcus sp. SYSU_G07232]|uniref:Tetratricopeptide repeat protein n=1 Tax=Chelatococcus albus TaxID=3047466 RepID=A0ABT7AIJ9_9HYPH|nr:tetratricopeptide repeat protein [Chelatococcus sp. SYSU_G07232]MDJ1159209.1 tetratricopeptide repeat protein [Chelatococcus sp. SYSU_G07232]
MKKLGKHGVILLALALSGCQAFTDAADTAKPHLEAAVDPKYEPSDEPARLGRDHFARGHFGLSERYFRDAVEKTPRDGDAWVGLAASYDHLRRFDLADRAYKEAVRLKGETVQILNNRGYSYLLRGNVRQARIYFNRALSRDPQNPNIINNLALLEQAQSYFDTTRAN